MAGLIARRAAGATALTILSCDNLPENGAVTQEVVRDLAALVDGSLTDWIETNIAFATSMVDRITPATTDDDRKLVEEACGYVDAYPRTDRTLQRVGDIGRLHGGTARVGKNQAPRW